YLRLSAAGKPAKVAITAVMRKLLLLANTLLRQDRLWQSRDA
ncbi:MAG: IS110 family transposase, partial [Pseudomonadota bacterium]